MSSAHIDRLVWALRSWPEQWTAGEDWARVQKARRVAELERLHAEESSCGAAVPAFYRRVESIRRRLSQ